MEHLFYTRQLTVGYDGKPLIREIEIRLQPGQILTLIGPNGAGKSTILKSIVRQLRPLGGVVCLDGRPLGEMSGRELAKGFSLVLTQRLRTELMTAEDIVATGRHPHTGPLGILSQGDWAQVEEAMALVGVTNLRHRDFMELSDGQRQRVLLARALCQQPRVIVLDEPTSFLDIRYSLELLSTLRSLCRRQGIGVIMSLHELSLAQRVSDQVMCVGGEYITHWGSVEEVFQRERIHSLYHLTQGSYNPLFGSVELPPPTGEPQVFVIAGGGCGTPVYRELQKRQIPFAAGVLHLGDVDYQAARDLAGAVVTEESFHPIGEAAYQAALSAAKTCGRVLCLQRAYGPGNDGNRRLAREAAALGIPVFATLEEFLSDRAR